MWLHGRDLPYARFGNGCLLPAWLLAGVWKALLVIAVGGCLFHARPARSDSCA